MFLLFVIGIIFLILLTIIYFPSPYEKFNNTENKTNNYARKIGSSLPTLVSYLVQ